MPAKKCSNGKWKWGQNGSCIYSSKEAAENANKNYRATATYNDYPEAATNNAKRAIKYKEENGSTCGTQVGWTRARQLANRESISRETIARMASFKRHQQHKDVPYDEGCGGIMYDAWGGTSGVEWAIKKLDQIDKEKKSEKRVTEKVKTALQNKVKEHNDDVKSSKKSWNTKVSYKTMVKVFNRGVGAYNTNPGSVRPSVKSPEQWAFARCNSFNYALKNGKFRGGKHDTDLLPSNHPVVKKMKEDKNKRAKVGTMINDGIEMPLFTTKKEATDMAKEMGGSGFHEHTLDGQTVYMPFKSHEDIMNVMNKKNNKIDFMEKRIFNIETRIEQSDEGVDVVVGHASVYDSRSNNLGGFYEYIEKGAFTEELINKSDVRALINHDPNLILARNTSGTLRLDADEKGLKYEFDMPNTTYGKDLAISMKRGDITQSSFAFTVAEDDWSTDDSGNNIRTIKKIDRLYDVSPVTYPAYNMAESDLVVAKRGLEQYKQSLVEDIEEIIEEKENNLVRNSLISLNIELKKRK